MPKKMFARPHLFTVPMKFYFRAQDIVVTLPGAEVEGKLVLIWKRGPRRTQTEPFEVKEKLSSVDGSLSRSATTNQDLALICTMFKNAKTGGFEPKSASFSLREETEDGEEKKIDSATIDLSSYATPEKTTDKVELSFLDGKIRLSLTLSSHWLKSMNASAADDDGASTERELSDAMRTAAIEARWNEQAGKVEKAEALEVARAELAEVRGLYAVSQKELKSLRSQADRLASENRVLRREQRGGKRDEVILQLEAELVYKDQERADMEENLSKAFSSVLDDAHARITKLTAERDRLLVQLEEAQHGKKGGFRK